MNNECPRAKLTSDFAQGVLDTGEVVAVKKIAYTPGLMEEQFKNEVCRLMVVKHPNIVRFLGYCCETRHMCVKHEGKLCFAEMTESLVCLEYVPNKSLQNHISGAKIQQLSFFHFPPFAYCLLQLCTYHCVY